MDYWNNITGLYERLKASGEVTERSEALILEDLEYLETQLVKGLIFCESLRAKITGVWDDEND